MANATLRYRESFAYVIKKFTQSPVTSHQSPITNHQSPITSHQLLFAANPNY
ncbi:MAG: hypothetical protein F6K62_14405 [Sphaerospermopsis sp. SIO1G2]|nr:hypothetical protein [Sphaerospermopsis sp. SIO1G2]